MRVGGFRSRVVDMEIDDLRPVTLPAALTRHERCADIPAGRTFGADDIDIAGWKPIAPTPGIEDPEPVRPLRALRSVPSGSPRWFHRVADAGRPKRSDPSRRAASMRW